MMMTLNVNLYEQYIDSSGQLWTRLRHSDQGDNPDPCFLVEGIMPFDPCPEYANRSKIFGEIHEVGNKLICIRVGDDYGLAIAKRKSKKKPWEWIAIVAP